jgi:hypothetical protein
MKRIDDELKRVLTIASETALKLVEMNAIDFKNLPVDTLLLCYDSVDHMQRGVHDKLYFSHVDEEVVYCFPDGRTSKSTGDYKPYYVSFCLLAK